MTASNPVSGRAGAENELLAQLGLPPSASPEDVDQIHLAASQFLAAAPSSLRGWAHAQAAALDEAYLQLTDPVGLEGSALRSPTRPPTVVPGGPATPPARRDPVPAVEVVEAKSGAGVATTLGAATAELVAPSVAETSADALDDTDTDDLDALYASVTPGAHRDLVSGGRPEKTSQPTGAARRGTPPRPAAIASAASTAVTPARRHSRAARPRNTALVVAPAPTSAGPWKPVAIGASVLLALIVVVAFVVPFVFNLGTAAVGNPGSSQAAQASPTAPAVDQAKVAALMAKIQANPKDTVSLLALGDEFFAGQQFTQAATFYDQALALDPNNIQGLLARGATYYNLGDTPNAEKTWKQVVALKPTDRSQQQEVHYDLGFLYLNSDTPNWTGVQSEWDQVIAIDATTQLAQTVQQHLTSMAQASMLPAAGSPAASGSPAPSGSASASGSPAASGQTSPAPSTAGAPSGSPAASVAPSGAGS